MFKFMFDTKVSKDNVKVEFMRTIFKTGYPIIKGPTYGDRPSWEDQEGDGWEVFSVWIYDMIDQLDEKFPKEEYKTYAFASGVQRDNIF